MSEAQTGGSPRNQNVRQAVSEILARGMADTQPVENQPGMDTELETEELTGAQDLEAQQADTQDYETDEIEETLQAGEPGDEIEETEEPEDTDGAGFDGGTLQDIWRASGMDPAELYDLELKLADGSTAKLGQLKDEVQDAHQMKANLEKAHQQFIEQAQAAQQQVQQTLAQASQLPVEMQQAQAEMNALAQQFNNTNWQELERQDPGAAALHRQKMNEQFQVAQGKYQQVSTQIQQAQQQLADTHRAENQKRVQHEQQLTLQHIPAWKEPAAMRQDLQAIASTLQPYGFAPKELGAIGDHRILRVLRRLAELEGQTLQATEKLTKTPKPKQRILKPGAVQNKRKINKRVQAERKATAKKGNLRTKAAYIGQILSKRA